MNKNNSAIKNTDKNLIVISFVLITALTVWLDLNAAPLISFAIIYILIVYFAVVYIGSPLSYFFALITALARSYDAYKGYPSGEAVAILIWQAITYLTTHTLFCYLFTLQYKTGLWLKAVENPYLSKEIYQFPKIREFIFRPYVNRYWRLSKRLDMIENHYRLVASDVPFLNLAHDECIEVTQFDFGDEKLRVIIDRPKWMRREGEIGLGGGR